jgi:hypothetical protein
MFCVSSDGGIKSRGGGGGDLEPFINYNILSTLASAGSTVRQIMLFFLYQPSKYQPAQCTEETASFVLATVKLYNLHWVPLSLLCSGILCTGYNRVCSVLATVKL